MRIWPVACLFAFACGCGSQPDDPSTTPDAPAQTTPRCGDGVCEGTEVGHCPSDCGAAGACGDGTCGANESAATCPADCSAGQTCGDGICTPPETDVTCPGDCAAGGGSAVCGNLACEAGEDAVTCPTDCGGGGSTCPGDPVDCVFCWVDPTTCIPPQTEAICGACLGLDGGGSSACNVDLVCDPGEDATNCPSDCP